jgi:hypothetical protein
MSSPAATHLGFEDTYYRTMNGKIKDVSTMLPRRRLIGDFLKFVVFV